MCFRLIVFVCHIVCNCELLKCNTSVTSVATTDERLWTRFSYGHQTIVICVLFRSREYGQRKCNKRMKNGIDIKEYCTEFVFIVPVVEVAYHASDGNRGRNTVDHMSCWRARRPHFRRQSLKSSNSS